MEMMKRENDEKRRKVALIFCLLLMFGCQAPTKFTTREEYSEERVWDQEEGIVKNTKATWEIHWE